MQSTIDFLQFIALLAAGYAALLWAVDLDVYGFLLRVIRRNEAKASRGRA